MNETTTKLLITAGALMLISEIIFAFTKQWIIAALLLAGALGCFVGGANFKNSGKK